jgi:hypothetical protein
VLAGCVRTLKEVKAQVVRDGWTPALARRAQTALRIAAAVALDRRIAQQPAPPGAAERDGQIVVRAGTLRPRRVLVSASTTPIAIGRELEAGNGAVAGRDALQQIQHSLGAFNRAAYGRDADLDRTMLDNAIDEGMDAIRRLRLRRLWRPVVPFRREQWASS